MLHCKWSLAILSVLAAGPCRTLALARRVRGIRLKVLFERLRELEAAEIIARKDNARYPRVVVYRLTDLGDHLAPLLKAWAKAGFEWEVLEMVLKCKWTSPILQHLRDGERRPVELHMALPGAGKRQLFERLAWLENRGLIARRIRATRPVISTYRLTPEGKRLVRAVLAWDATIRAIAQNA